MPNYVRNNLSFKGSRERVREILEFIKREDGAGCIDFNKIVPMPEELNIDEGSNTSQGIEVFLTYVNPQLEYRVISFTEKKFNELYSSLSSERRFATYRKEVPKDELKKYTDDQIKELFALGKQACDNKLAHGYTTWYHWSVNRWGTKWNACDSGLKGRNTVVFDTAWSAPVPVLEELSTRFPDVEMTLVFADEDIGSNCGRVIYSAGNEIKCYIPKGKRAVKFACKVWGYDPEEYLGDPEYAEE